MQLTPEFKARVTDQYGEFIVEPLPRGYGVTLGNPLRRILLSSVAGTAVTSVYIEDVLHEFSTIPGVKEDVMQIILNLKELVVKLHDDEPVTLTLRAENPGRVTAADFEVPMGATLINPELYLATLNEGGKLVMEVRVEPGIGYVPAEVHATKDRINSIPVDAVFTPVRRVAYRVEDTRVGQKTDLDRLVLRVWTDGSVSPREALDSAVEILRNQLSVFSGGVIDEPLPVMAIPPRSADEPLSRAEPARISLESLELSSRVLHSLQEEGIDSVDALLALSERDLKKVGGVGDKSLEEIKERLQAQGLYLKE
ncbi:DNA-directed RNA polymerase subunit alpha [Truepera radiovictrix]|uniref:DNA-directed RNA polymerase subunit alpha n=1 Tax=Truepera radiovictrix (strain DSM 17093 / CIP 108686 / LMG 22925 / RQ-24) TaxID=649638 RepID=D7CVG5_TRURR|nr:DNA-directed RNA polymerase subunit alpha [Truepera radiovictrix]ADI14193.1 DNA-directed RNA polymerase, alpha subunit [Truepera radiovictrix DSM 17093]WMT57249.1 DNA-directed RNA polymerase subunit alpha [Truepera radiovictrix]